MGREEESAGRQLKRAENTAAFNSWGRLMSRLFSRDPPPRLPFKSLERKCNKKQKREKRPEASGNTGIDGETIFFFYFLASSGTSNASWVGRVELEGEGESFKSRDKG